MKSIARHTPLLFPLFAMHLALADLGPLPDPSWGGPGGDSTVYVAFDLVANNYDSATSSLLQDDGKLVLVGAAQAVAFPSTNYDLGVVRLNAADGTPDLSFGGGDGRLNLNLVPSSNARVAQEANGRLWITASQTDSSAVLIRMLDDGSLDPAFDQDGKKFISAGTFLDGASSLTPAIVVSQPGGKSLVLASAVRQGPPLKICIGLIRLNANGSIDSTFAGGAGRICEAPAYESFNAAQVLGWTLAADGDLLLAGAAYHSGGSAYDMAVLKVSTDGVRDTTFGEDGWAFAPFDEGGNLIELASAIVTDSEDRILLGGAAYVGTFASAAAFARLTSDGQLDTTFDQDGKTLLDLGPINTNTTFSISSIVLTGADRIVVGGRADEGSFLAMLRDDGTPHPQFGDNGRFLSPRGTSVGMHWQGDSIYSVGSGNNPASNRTAYAASRRIIALFRDGFD